MFGYYSAPSHFYAQPSPRSSFYAPPSSTCRHQHRYAPSFSCYDDEEDERETEYRRYLAAARQEQVRRELQESRARKAAQEKHAYLQAMARAQAEAEAEARAEAQARARAQAEYEAAYRRYMQQQAEQQRQARQAEEERHRQAQVAYEQFLARAILGCSPGTARPTASTTSTPTPPASSPAPSTFTPAVQLLPTPAQPKMSYSSAVQLVQSLAKQQLAIRRRVKSLHAIHSHFEQLKRDFTMPDSLVFDTTKSTVSPFLAYDSTNLPLRKYEESLTRLLTDLDNIPSEGSHRVRDERKALATAVEQELSRLDEAKNNEWSKQQAKAADEAEASQDLVLVVDNDSQLASVSREQEMEVDCQKQPEQASTTDSRTVSPALNNESVSKPSLDNDGVSIAQPTTPCLVPASHPTLDDQSKDHRETQGEHFEQGSAAAIPVTPSQPEGSACEAVQSSNQAPSDGAAEITIDNHAPAVDESVSTSPSKPLPLLLPFGMGVLDIVEEPEDARVAQDEDSDTSFEML